MQIATNVWMGVELSDTEFGEVFAQLLAREDVALLPNMLVLAERHRAFWDSETGEAVLAGVLNLLVEALDAGMVEQALAAIDVCPQHLAERGLALLQAAVFPDGPRDASELDDAVLLCLALLIGGSGMRQAVAPFLDKARDGRIAAFFAPRADAIAAHFAAAPAVEVFKTKLVIWDLDDTLWQGTLADGDEPVLDEKRAEYVRAFNRHGIVSAICSKNDFAAAKAQLEGFGLWDEFVFPRIAFVPKGAVVKAMIADMQLRPANVLFVDDNPANLHAVAEAVPGIQVADATSPECDALLEQILGENAHVRKNRIGDYRLLETKVAEREENQLSDEEFLLSSGIHATFTDRMDNLEFAGRIEELINRSNQLNYTQSRVEPGTMIQRIQDIDYYEVLCAFVWDRYGYYGLVGVAVYAFRTKTLEHFAFSCRIMHMGVEAAMIRMLAERGYPLAAGQMKKPLPPQSARAVTTLSFADPAVRARVLAEEAPRDWSKVKLRIMADCQSGAFFHYSRFRDEIDYDNNPRLFNLPHMATGEYKDQSFPTYLVYTAATDYIVWRWQKLTPNRVDYDMFVECADRFVEEIVVAGGRQCLMFLPPQGLAPEMYELHVGCVREEARAIHPALNDYWRGVAAKYPAHFTLVELGEVLAADELVHAHHYVPSALQRMSGMIDDWYEERR